MNHAQPVEHWNETAEAQHNAFSHYVAGDDQPQNELARKREAQVVIVDKRALERECLAHCVLEHDPTLRTNP